MIKIGATAETIVEIAQGVAIATQEDAEAEAGKEAGIGVRDGMTR